ncbi:MAG: hypothetical protein ACSHW4_09620 [Cellulophaga sp.]
MGAQNSSSYNVSYHNSLVDAQLNKNALDKFSYTNNIAYNETIYARVENVTNRDCYDANSFKLIVSHLPMPLLEKEYVICSDNPSLTINAGDFETW